MLLSVVKQFTFTALLKVYSQMQYIQEVTSSETTPTNSGPASLLRHNQTKRSLKTMQVLNSHLSV